jgi:hypothetical protein
VLKYGRGFHRERRGKARAAGIVDGAIPIDREQPVAEAIIRDAAFADASEVRLDAGPRRE